MCPHLQTFIMQLLLAQCGTLLRRVSSTKGLKLQLDRPYQGDSRGYYIEYRQIYLSEAEFVTCMSENGMVQATYHTHKPLLHGTLPGGSSIVLDMQF
jgi:hypothetical protein